MTPASAAHSGQARHPARALGRGLRLLPLDLCGAAWLAFSLHAFTGWAWAPVARLAAAAAVLAGASLAMDAVQGGHRPPRELGRLAAALALGLAVATGAGAWLLGIGAPQAAWWGAAFALFSTLQRLLRSRLEPLGPTLGETARLGLLLAAATASLRPYYYNGSVGSGDAHWYTMMLGDFVAQMRHGVFPVWIGQSPFAFNGAVSPIRFAPAVLVLGGLLDLVTCRGLELAPLINAEICCVGIAAIASGYACLRLILPRHPWLAALLAVLWSLSPGLLAPPLLGDMFMTYTTLPFVPWVLLGSWLVLTRDSIGGRVLLAAALACVWYCHPPIALWLTGIATALYLPVVLRGPLARQLALAFGTAGLFLLLGSVPFASVGTLDSQYKVVASKSATIASIQDSFPGNFSPFKADFPGLYHFQLGYSLVAVLALALALTLVRRDRFCLALAAVSGALACAALPVPGINAWLWSHAPGWFVSVQNIWPVQRLFLVWSSVIVFHAAAALAAFPLPALRLSRQILVGIFFLGIGWSWSQTVRMQSVVESRRGTAASTRRLYSPDNLVLTRYAYSSFERVPDTFSHGHMDPVFENRLLDPESFGPVAGNADAAAPLPGTPEGAAAAGRLVASGDWIGRSITHTSYYKVEPSLPLKPGRAYALRLEFAKAGREGVLEILSPSLNLEYLLPDSGGAIAPDRHPAAFGSLAGSGHVIPLRSWDPAPPLVQYLAPGFEGETVTLGRYFLYTYDGGDLPIRVSSLIPYTVHVAPRTQALLESPRVWMNGWRATVDGRPAGTIRTPSNLVAVAVAPGAHTVVLRYEPPLVLAVSFWSAFASWGLLAGLVAASLGAGGRTALKRAARCLDNPWGIRCLIALPVAAAVALAAAATGERASRLRTGEQRTVAAGPGIISVNAVAGESHAGDSETLLACGDPHAPWSLSLEYADRGRPAFVFSAGGSRTASEPVSITPGSVFRVVVGYEDPRVWDPGGARFDASEGPPAPSRRVYVEVDGRRVLLTPAPVPGPSLLGRDAVAGAAPHGELMDPTRGSRILSATRIAEAVHGLLPSDRHLRIALRLAGRVGYAEALAQMSTLRGPARLRITQHPGGRATFALGSPSGARSLSITVPWDPLAPHTLELWTVEPDAGLPANVACSVDGAPVFGGRSGPAGGAAVVDLAPPGAEPDGEHFCGLLDRVELVPASPGGAQGREGAALHMVLSLPAHAAGTSEPLLCTGTAGRGDVVYVSYGPGGTARIGFDHWAYGGPVSAPFSFDPAVLHELWISTGALNPASSEASGPGGPAALANHVTVLVDGQPVLSAAAAAYPTQPEAVRPLENPIGASTCRAAFSGKPLLVERAPPPWAASAARVP